MRLNNTNESIERITFNTMPKDESDADVLFDTTIWMLQILESYGRPGRLDFTQQTRRNISKALDLMEEAKEMFDMSDDEEYNSQY